MVSDVPFVHGVVTAIVGGELCRYVRQLPARGEGHSHI